MRGRLRLTRLSEPLLVVLAATMLAVLVATPQGGPAWVVDMAALAGMLALALAGTVAVVYLPANAFCIASVAILATLQLSVERPVAVGGVALYSTDILLLLVFARAAMPRDRLNTGSGFTLPTRVLIGAWLTVMVLAVMKGIDSGTELDTVLRLFSPVAYWVGFYVGFLRIFREIDFRPEQFIRDFIAVSLVLVGYMLAMRGLNRPFETSESGALGRVVTSEGDVLRRDYGLWSAYIIYPMLALICLARLAYVSTNHVRWALLAGIGVVATLMTLIRGEIYGLALGVAVLLLALKRDEGRAAASLRMRVVAVMSGVIVVAAVLLAIVNPVLAKGVAERALPGLQPQSEQQRLNAQYRYDSLVSTVEGVGDRLLGFGFVDRDVLERNQIDPFHLEHSAPARLLVYTGWLGLAAALSVLFALAFESTRSRAGPPWLHAMFVATLVMLVAYSLSASGIAGQAHVVTLATMLAAFRFARAFDTT